MEPLPNEEYSMSVLMDKLTEAIINQDLDNFKQLINNSSREWCRKTNSFGYTLLQETIRRNWYNNQINSVCGLPAAKEIFDYILPFQDVPDLEAVNFFDQTALKLVLKWKWNKWNQCGEYYACELIKKGAFVHTVCKNARCDTFLHRAVAKSSMKVTKLLLEKGIDVNLQDKNGRTALHNVLLKGPHSDDYEFVAALLCYGADPFIECFKGYNAFELSVLYNHSDPIQEILFYYTCDEFTCCEIHLEVLLQLAKVKSPFFYQIMECDLEFKFMCSGDRIRLFCDLLLVDVDCLKVLLRKHNSVISEIIQRVGNDSQCTQHNLKFKFNMTMKWCKSLHSHHSLTNLNFLLEHDTILNHHIVNFITNLNSILLCSYIIRKLDQANATEVLIYMFLYGLKCNSEICDAVYIKYGYCALFKFLLHLDLQMFPYPKNIMPALIYDLNLDLDKFFEKPNNFFCTSDGQLLDYFAHPELSNCLLNGPQWWHFSKETVRKIENHPQMPNLVELSRNAFRKHFVNRLNIKTTKQFYYLLNGLQISPVHKKIITFETKLY